MKTTRMFSSEGRKVGSFNSLRFLLSSTHQQTDTNAPRASQCAGRASHGSHQAVGRMLGKRGTNIVPAKLRKRYGIEEGTLVSTEAREDDVLLRFCCPQKDTRQSARRSSSSPQPKQR